MITVRVYGLLINEDGEILISNERILKKRYNKFPGGGLEFGESTVDCLIREMKEETGIDVRVIQHFYTTDYFVPSAFHEEQMQVLAIYYFLEAKDEKQVAELDSVLKIDKESPKQVFIWANLDTLKKEDLSLPIDQTVAERIISYVQQNQRA